MKNYLHESWTFNKPAMELHDFKIRFQTAQEIFNEIEKLIQESEAGEFVIECIDIDKVKQKYTGEKE